MAICKYCGEEIGWRNDGGKNISFNADGSLHKPTCKPPAGTKESITGLLTGYNSGSATFRVKGGATRTYAVNQSLYTAWQSLGFGPDQWIEFCIDTQGFIQPGARNVQQPDWGADLKDPTGGVIKDPFTKASELPKETPCTSPAAAPAPERKFTSGDLFTPKDRLIVAQCLLKCWTDLYIHSNPPDDLDWEAGRGAILAAVEEDLAAVMNAGTGVQ